MTDAKAPNLTDRQRWADFFSSYGLYPREPLPHETENAMTFEAQHGGMDGYLSFCLVVSFDDAGRFVGAGVWE